MDRVNFLAKFSQVFQKGEIIFSEDSLGTEMFVICSGAVNLVKGKKNAKVLASLEQGDMFGEMALISSEIRTATAVADQDDTRIVAIDHARFVYLVGQQPAFALAVMQVMADRLRDQTSQLYMTEQRPTPTMRDRDHI